MESSNREMIEARLKRLRVKLAEKNTDAILVTKRENYIYLSGFTGTSAYLLVTGQDAILITDFRYVEQAALQAPVYEVVQYQGSLIETLNNLLKSKGVEKLGFEESYITYDKYNEYVTKLEIKEFVPTEGLIEKLRIVKDQQEIDIIKKAVKIADDTFTHILKFLKPGIMEIEVAAEMEHHMKKLGAKKASFETIVASGKRSSMPHGVASEKKLEAGDTITLDFGALYKEYCSDMTRTVFLGQPNEEIKKIYNIVLEAQRRATEGAKAGLLGREIDAIARDYITANGYGDNFGHGLGHGVGLEIHEEPRFSKLGNVIMENNMVVTNEPGIYVNDLGGVRIEDIIVIHNDTPIVLTESSKDIIII